MLELTVGLGNIIVLIILYTAGLFPIRWTAPEATGCNYFADSSADVWSFGVLMYEVLTYGGLPYAEIPEDEILAYLKNGNRLPNPCKPEWSQSGALYGVMLRCWAAEPKERPTFKALKQEQLFSN
ncbi:unnamed protein product [Dibothriocephalus latus]|uniref:Protein kinase domain-containing protein n=1 Tax=Dibothriocephalus latus TaxID=60516 RepID=A0A3P6TLY0_DIBLA|nr:unnamed protein product [Dibothriocephalus latus]